MPFFNIFSKSKKKNSIRNPIKIIVDNREKNALVATELSKLGFQIEFKHLLVADYIVNDIVIERKTISDLKSSIIDKRIISQLLELKQYSKHILILEGIEKDINPGIIHENAFRGFLLSVVLEYKVPMIFTQDYKDTAKYLSILAKKSPKEDFALRAKKIISTEKEQVQYILEGFPGIGPITAKKLIKKFRSLDNIFTAPESELQEILGKKAQIFKSLLKSKFV